MRRHLNRIEYDYIITIFLKRKPPLCLQYKSGFLNLSSDSYELKDGIVSFQSTRLKSGEEVKILFDHRGRLLYFFSTVEELNGRFIFKLSEELYKYDSDDKKVSIPSIRFSNLSGFNLEVNTSPFFPIRFSHPTGKNEENKKPSSLDTRFYEILAKEVHELPCPALVYIDTSHILLICTEKDSKLFSLHQPIRTEVKFGIRVLDFISNHGSFHPISQTDIPETNIGILCLFVKDMKEEDKRFLHEYVYTEKYDKI